MKFRLAISLVCFLGLVPSLFAQDSSLKDLNPADPQTPAFRTGTSIVLIPALVRTRGGEVVFTLTARDFTATDDGIEQPLTLEEDTDHQPLALVIVLETGGGGAGKLGSYGKLRPMLDSLVGNVPHTVALVGFDSKPKLLQDFTPDLDLFEGQLKAVGAGTEQDVSSDGGAAILDSLGFAVDLLRKQPTGYRRSILLISETVDRGSQMTLDEALRAVSDTNTVIYSLGFSTTKADMKREAGKFSSDTPGPRQGCMSRDASDPNVVAGQSRTAQTYDCLSQLAPPLRAAKMAVMAAIDGLHKNVPESVAHLTGGEYFKFENAQALERGLVTISNHIPNRYVLSFHPASPHPGLHAIALRLHDYPNLVVTARNSYWVEDEPAQNAVP